MLLTEAKKVEIPRGEYYPLYYKTVIDFFPISKTSLKVGMICKLNYKAKYRDGKKTSLYLIISMYDGNIHAIDLDYVEPSKLKLLLNLCVNKKAEILQFSKSKGYIFPFKTRGEELYKQIVSYVGDGAYRVLKPFKLYSIVLCNLSVLVNSVQEPSKEKNNKKEINKKDTKDDKKEIDDTADKNK